MKLQNCDACGRPKHDEKELLRCGKCRQAHYHDRICQKKHWSQHKRVCQKLVLEGQEREQQNISVRVSSTDDKGRVASALRDFNSGERVVLESPAIVFDTRLEYAGLLEAFGGASQETRAKVLDLHAPPLADIDSPERRRRHARLEHQRLAYLQRQPEKASAITEAVAQKLLAIVETNSYQLFNANLGENGDPLDPQRWRGLFTLASMPEHCCNPVMTLNTTRDGKVELIAETHIATGERLSFSYIEGIFEQSRETRRKTLLQEKHFDCQCSRCQDVDECRPILLQDVETRLPSICHLCGVSHPLFWHAGSQQYLCIMSAPPNNTVGLAHQAALNDFLKSEADLVRQFHRLEQSLQNGECPMEQILLQLAALVTSPQWQKTIHPLHWLQVSAYQFLATTLAAMARIQKRQQETSWSRQAAFHLRLSVLALLHNILWLELTIRTLRCPTPSDSNPHRALQHSLAAAEDEEDALVLVRRALQASLTHPDGTFAVEEAVLSSILRTICESPGSSLHQEQSITADTLLTVFYAGQDLLLAGHVDLCLLLYGRYHAWFHKLKQPSDDNRERIDLFLSSQGRSITFGDDLM